MRRDSIITSTFSLQDREAELEERTTGHESIRTQRERIVELEGLLATHVSQAKDAEDRVVKLELDLKSSQAAEGELVERARIAEERATHHESSLKQVTTGPWSWRIFSVLTKTKLPMLLKRLLIWKLL